MAEHAPVKPVGGVASVELLPAQAVSYASPAPGGGVTLTLRAGQAFTPLELFEQKNSYTEQLFSDAGLPHLRHTLEVVCDPESLRGRTLGEWMLIMSTEGVLARVRTASGAALLVGWSARFGLEQPLRLVSSEELTHTAARDRPSLRMVFQSDDLSPAVTY